MHGLKLSNFNNSELKLKVIVAVSKTPSIEKSKAFPMEPGMFSSNRTKSSTGLILKSSACEGDIPLMVTDGITFSSSVLFSKKTSTFSSNKFGL